MTRRTAAQSRPCGERDTALNKLFRKSSLGVQLLLRVLLSFVLALIVFFTLMFLSFWALDNTVYGEYFNQRVTERKIESLRDYIDTNHISTEDLDLLNGWCRKNKTVCLTLYANGEKLFSAYIPHTWSTDTSPDSEEFEKNVPGTPFDLTLSDGTLVNAYLAYEASALYEYVALLISGVLSFLTFSITFIHFVSRKFRGIKQIKEDLTVLAGGDFTHPIRITGPDELGELAYDIDQMRLSILEHQKKEDEIRSGNSKLVTAMSHDLRTPLTSLIAYLELLDRKKYQGEEQHDYFISRSLSQAMRIKSLADQLFTYFLVYSSEGDEHLHPEIADASTLFEQIWNEYALSFENQGFFVETNFQPLHGSVRVDLDLLHRVFDNVYGNTVKYADRTLPVQLTCKMRGQAILLRLSNRIAARRGASESTHIGLNTCKRVMEYHHGTFETEESDEEYIVTLTLPTYEDASGSPVKNGRTG